MTSKGEMARNVSREKTYLARLFNPRSIAVIGPRPTQRRSATTSRAKAACLTREPDCDMIDSLKE